MIDFIINTKSFDKAFLSLCFVNIVIIFISTLKEKKNNKKYSNSSINSKRWIYYIQLFWSIIISLLSILALSIFLHNILIIFVIIIYLIKLFIRTVRTDIFNSTLENKYSCVICSLLLINFFIYNNYGVYLDSFQSISHGWKEIMLIIFIVLKIISYIYFIILNVSILFSFFKVSKLLIGISGLISKLIDCSKIIVSFLSNSEKELSSSEFSLKNWIIYFLFFPLFVVSTLLIGLLLKVVFDLTNLIISIVNIADCYTKSSKFFVWIIVKISIIISLVLAYFIVISSNIFSDKVINAYNYLSTVILIPILLNSFQEINKKRL